jgi:adenine-specific DNA methylase
MKKLNEFIIEKKLTNIQQKLVGEYICNIFSGSKLHKDTVKQMLSSLIKNGDIQPIIELSEYIENVDKSNAFPFLPSKDDYLKKDNYPQIIDMLSQYIEKYIC